MNDHQKLRELLGEAKHWVAASESFLLMRDGIGWSDQRKLLEAIDAALAQPVSDYVAFVGPCAHGRDPWDRCEMCGEGSELEAAVVALETARIEAKQLEKQVTLQDQFKRIAMRERDEARAEVERLREDLHSTHAELDRWRHEVSLQMEFRAFARGAEAMREAAVKECEDRALDWRKHGDPWGEQFDQEATECARDIRALPIPEDKP